MVETKYDRIVTELNELKKYLQDDISDQYVKITIIYNRLLKTIVDLMVRPKGIPSAAETKAALDNAIRDGIDELTKAYSEIGQRVPYLSDDIRSIINQYE